MKSLPILQDLAAPVNNTQQWIFCDMHKDSGLVTDQVADAAYQSTTTSQHNSSINDVCSQLGRSAFERSFHRLNDHIERFSDCFTQVSGLQDDGTWKTGEQVQATDIHGLLVKVIVGES